MLSRPKTSRIDEVFSSTDKIEYFMRNCSFCKGDGCIVTVTETKECPSCNGTGFELGYRQKCSCNV